MKRRGVLLISMLCLFNLTLWSMPYSILGNINIPHAYVLPDKMIDFAYTNYFVGDGITTGDIGTIQDNLYDFSISINFGLFNQGEFGVVYTSTAGIFGNLKVKLMNETKKMPALSFGITNLLSSVKDYDNLPDTGYTDRQDYISNSPYMVASKSLSFNTGISVIDHMEIALHGGIGLRRFQGKGEIVRKVEGVFGGLDIKPSKYFGFDLEWDSQNINFGLNCFCKNFTLRAGMFEVEDFFGAKGDNGSKKIAVNLQYTLDNYSESKITDKKRR